jgi:DNA-binding response OmpR family regulator
MARILVIEDDENIRSLCRRILEQDGHQVSEAAEGNTGTRLYREQGHDLVITDIIMPEKEGIETIIDLRREFSDVRIIAVSGGGKVTSSVTCLQLAKNLGASHTLVKPFTKQELLDAVRSALEPA